jgi:translocation and assembly module TamB
MSAYTTLKQLVKKTCQWPIIMLLVIFFATATTGHWILNSTSGLQWFLSSITRISSGAIAFEGVQGKFSTMRINTLHFTNDDLQLVIHDLELNWHPNQLFTRKLLVNHISAQSIEFYSFSSEQQGTSPTLPENLHLPIAVAIHNLEVASLSFFSENVDAPDFVANDLAMQLESDGRHHQLINLEIDSKFGAFKASAEIEGHRPFNLSAQADLKHADQWGELKAILTGSLVQLDIQLNANGTGISGDMNAQVQPFTSFPVESLYISLDRLNPTAFSSELPNVNLSFFADLNKDVAQQLVGEITVTNHTIAPFNDEGLPLSAIKTQVQLSANLLQFNNMYLHFPDNGLISGNVSWNLDKASGLAALNVHNLNPLVIDSRLQAAHISGIIKLKGSEESQNVMIQLHDDSLNFDALLTHAHNVLTLDRFHLNHGQSRLTGQGILDLGNEQSYDFTANLEQFNLSDFIQGPDSDLNAAIVLAGSSSPQITGTLNYTIKESHLAKHNVSGNGQITFNDLAQLTSNAKLNIGSNHFHIHGGFGLPGENLLLDIMAPSLAQIGFGFSGHLKAQLTLGGSLEAPEIRFDIESKHLALPSDHKIENLAAKGEFQNETISLQLDAANFAIENKTQVQRLGLKITGKKSKHQIQTEVQINDETTVQLHATGGVKPTSVSNSTLQWLGQLSQLSVSGLMPVHLQAPVSLELSSQRIILAAAQFSIAGGQASINEILWTPQHWQSQGNFTGIAVHYGSDLVAQEDMLHLGGNWRFVSSKQLDGSLHITREKGDWYTPGEFPRPLGLQTLQFNVEANNRKISSQFDLISEQIGRLDAQLTLPITQSEKKWSISQNASLKGNILINSEDLSWLDLIVNDNIKSNGQLVLQANITGTLNKPALQGNVKGQKLAVSLLDQGLQLEHGNLIANFDQSNIHINELNFSAPFEPPPNDRLLGKLTLQDKPGSLAISGTIGLSDDTHHVDVTLDQLPFSHPSHYWIILSGDGHAKIQNNTLNLNGKIIADAGLLMQPPSGHPKLADDIIIGDETSDEQQAALINIDATLDLGKQFYLRASGLEGQLAGQLHASNDAQQALNVTGSIATKKATFTAYGQNLQVKRGIVNFHGPLDDPGLNVLAIRTGLPVEAGVEVMGTVRHPKVRLVSEPNVPDSEKLSWVVLGRSLDAGGVDSALLLAAAGSIFGGQSGSGGITQQLSDALGVDQISFRQGETGNPLGSQIGTVGKRLSSRAYISYERGLTATAAGVTKLTYNLTPKIKIVTRAGVDSAVDMFYTFRFD